jgi:hypothetical protein
MGASFEREMLERSNGAVLLIREPYVTRRGADLLLIRARSHQLLTASDCFRRAKRPQTTELVYSLSLISTSN